MVNPLIKKSKRNQQRNIMMILMIQTIVLQIEGKRRDRHIDRVREKTSPQEDEEEIEKVEDVIVREIDPLKKEAEEV